MSTQNDYNIPIAITDKDDKSKGIIPSNGTTKKEIIDKTQLSSTKVNNTIRLFLTKGYIKEALSVGNSKSYILTKEGIKLHIESKGGVFND